MVFPLRSATEATIRHLENAIISTTEKSATRQVKRQGDALTVFFYSNGIVHIEFIPQGATVDKILYKEILGRLSNSIRRKRPELWHRKNWLLLHDNAPAHRSILVQEELARQQVAVLPHPPYSPDLAPCDFFSLSPHEINPTRA